MSLVVINEVTSYFSFNNRGNLIMDPLKEHKTVSFNYMTVLDAAVISLLTGRKCDVIIGGLSIIYGAGTTSFQYEAQKWNSIRKYNFDF